MIIVIIKSIKSPTLQLKLKITIVCAFRVLVANLLIFLVHLVSLWTLYALKLDVDLFALRNCFANALHWLWYCYYLIIYNILSHSFIRLITLQRIMNLSEISCLIAKIIVCYMVIKHKLHNDPIEGLSFPTCNLMNSNFESSYSIFLMLTFPPPWTCCWFLLTLHRKLKLILLLLLLLRLWKWIWNRRFRLVLLLLLLRLTWDEGLVLWRWGQWLLFSWGKFVDFLLQANVDLWNYVHCFGVFRVERLLFCNLIILRIRNPDIHPSHRNQLQVFNIFDQNIRICWGFIKWQLELAPP